MEAWSGNSAHAVKYPFFETEKEKIRQGFSPLLRLITSGG
jgi:hypothetical protein